jgi:hypothetical protein
MILIYDCGVGYVPCGCGAAGDKSNNVCVLTQPAVSGHLKQISPFPRIGHQYSPEKVAGVRSHIFREGQRRRHYILVEKVNIIAFRVRRVVIKGQIPRKHGILKSSC